jgi:DNA helicase-2/ATP-dependent DNA helicase PcrA
MLRAVADPTDNQSVIAALQPLLNDKDLVSLYKINRASRSATPIIDKLLKEGGGLRKASSYILEANRLAQAYSIQELLEWLLHESSLISERLAGKDLLSQAEVLLAFYEEAKNFSAQGDNSLEGFLTYCQKISERNLEVSIVKLLPRDGLFTGTVHSAKGLEFDRVFIAGADEKRWSLKKKPELIKLPGEVVGLDGWEDNVVEDERRLFYVAVTRAMSRLTVALARTDRDNQTLLPCQFVSEIDGQLEKVTPDIADQDIVSSAYTMLRQIPTKQLSQQALEHARSVIASSPFSYSDMRCYQTCPRQYYLGRVLRLPQPPSETLIYGNVIHRALEQFFREYRGFKKMPTKQRLLELAGEAVVQLVPSYWQERMQEHCLKVLTAYYEAKSGSWRIPAGIEYSFTHHQVRYGNIWLTGKIDRLDTISGNHVRVVDYKTKSRAPSRNEIEGKTKNSDGEIKDQLVFYSMLASHDPLFPFVVKDCQVSIIDDQLKFPDEILAVSANEIKEMERRIESTYSEILSAESFTHTRLEFDKGCQLCQLYD